MSLRFTETNKWKDDWFLSLSNDNKIVWQYIIDNCSIAGIWKKGFTHLNYFCKTNLSEKQFKDIFGHKCYDIEHSYFIPNYIKVQYPSGINSNKPLIISVRKELIFYKLELIIKQSLGNDYLMVEQPLRKGDTGKGNWKGEEGEGKEEEGIEERKKIFMDSVGRFVEKYEKKMLMDFFQYWSEHNEGGKKMRFEMEKVFEINRRLVTWKSNENKFSKNGKQTRTAEGFKDAFERRFGEK